jgi:heat shock protein 4
MVIRRSRRAHKEFMYLQFWTHLLSHPTRGRSHQDTIGVKHKVCSAGVDTVVPIEAVAGMMIQLMAQVAAETQKSPMAADYVIAITVSYTDAQRHALLTACEVVGITTSGILRLMHENTAITLAYGIFKDLKKEFVADQPQHVLFIDMGASAFTASVTTFEPGKLMVKLAYYPNERRCPGHRLDDCRMC